MRDVRSASYFDIDYNEDLLNMSPNRKTSQALDEKQDENKYRGKYRHYFKVGFNIQALTEYDKTDSINLINNNTHWNMECLQKFNDWKDMIYLIYLFLEIIVLFAFL